MNKKITCSLAFITHLSNVLDVTNNNCEVENQNLVIRLFSDKKVVYEGTTETSEAGTVYAETVSIETTDDQIDYTLLNNLKYYIVIVKTIDGQIIVGNKNYPCSKVINNVDNKTTLTFSAKKPL